MFLLVHIVLSRLCDSDELMSSIITNSNGFVFHDSIIVYFGIQLFYLQLFRFFLLFFKMIVFLVGRQESTIALLFTILYSIR